MNKTKQKNIVSVFALIVLFGVAVKLYGEVRHARQVAILGVFNQMSSATTQTQVFPGGRTVVVNLRDKRFSHTVFIEILERISTVDCPREFSIAWLRFVQTLEVSDELLPRLGTLGEHGVSVIRPNAEVTQDALARLDRSNAPEAWRDVVMVALRYGVEIHDL